MGPSPGTGTESPEQLRTRASANMSRIARKRKREKEAQNPQLSQLKTQKQKKESLGCNSLLDLGCCCPWAYFCEHLLLIEPRATSQELRENARHTSSNGFTGVRGDRPMRLARAQPGSRKRDRSRIPFEACKLGPSFFEGTTLALVLQGGQRGHQPISGSPNSRTRPI